MRLLALAVVTLLFLGCSKGDVKAPVSSNDAARPSENAKPSSPAVSPLTNPDDDVVTWLHFRDVFLTCKTSQESARNALQALPGIQELKIDPEKRTIDLKAPFRLVNGLAFVSALSKAGLHGHFEWYDPVKKVKFGVVGQSILFPAGEPKPVDRVTLYWVFAGSPESQEAIRKALAPSRVTFMGADSVKSIGIEGKSLLPHKEVEKLFKAGFHASEHEDPWPGEKKTSS